MRIGIEQVEERLDAMTALARRGGKRGLIARVEMHVLDQMLGHLADWEDKSIVVEPATWRESM